MLTLKKIILLSCLLLICSKVSFAGDSVMTVPNTSGKEYLPVPVGSVQAWPIGSKKQKEKDAKGNPVWLECDGSTFDAANTLNLRRHWAVTSSRIIQAISSEAMGRTGPTASIRPGTLEKRKWL